MLMDIIEKRLEDHEPAIEIKYREMLALIQFPRLLDRSVPSIAIRGLVFAIVDDI